MSERMTKDTAADLFAMRVAALELEIEKRRRRIGWLRPVESRQVRRARERAASKGMVA